MGKLRQTLSILFLLSFFVSFAQITNTRKWRKTESDSMQYALIMYDEKEYLAALPIYEKLYYAHPEEMFLKFVYGRCCIYRSDKHEEALKLLTEVYEKNKKAENIEFDLAKAYHLNYKFDESIAIADQYLANKRAFPDDKIAAEQIKKYCNNAKVLYANPTNAKITHAGSVLNTEFEEYVPVVSADESIMIFTYVGKESTGGRQNKLMQPFEYGDYYEDVFWSRKKNGEWTKPVPISNINTNTHDAAIAISPDGQKLFVYRDNGDDHGDIYISYLKDTTWSVPTKILGEVNSFSWEGSCSLSSDGKTLYFSSERSGGYGGRDIYKASLQADSTWGKIVNLGDSINTALDDDAPYIHPDGVTLFYSSKGKNSMGGFDIFEAKMDTKDSVFRNPRNLGYPINTTDDDIYYVLAANGKTGYYASGKKGGVGLKDLYFVDPGTTPEKSPIACLVKGTITFNKQPVEGNISVVVTSKNNQVYANLKSNTASGNYVTTFPAGAVYKITLSYQQYYPRTLEFDATNITQYTEKIFDCDFSIPPDTAKPVVMDTLPKNPDDGFTSIWKLQEKAKKYARKYGDRTADGLIFKVQIAAYRKPKNYRYRHLKGLGKVERLLLGDGITRMTIGGNFKSLQSAYTHMKKVIVAGQGDAFITVLYKGKRIYLEDLEKMGILK